MSWRIFPQKLMNTVYKPRNATESNFVDFDFKRILEKLEQFYRHQKKAMSSNFTKDGAFLPTYHKIRG